MSSVPPDDRPDGSSTGGRRRASARVRRNRLVAGGGILVAAAVLALVLTLVNRGDERLAATGSGQAPAGGPIRPDGEPAPSSTAAAPAPSSTAAAPAGPPAGEPVTLAFGGDVHFEGQIRARLLADPASVLAGVAPILQAADVAVVNLETAITARGTKPPGKEFAFRAPPSGLTALKMGGVDVASMANNHGMDYGREGLEDSLAASAATGLPLIGIGRNATEAYRPHIAVAKGQRIAIIGATQVLDDSVRTAWTATDSQPGLASAKEVDRLTAAVQAARGQADTVVVVLHWGIEGQTCPSPAQSQLAQQLVDAGADVIVGGHAHRLQGAGRLGSAFVAYGLGNFVFYTSAGPGTETGVLTVTVRGRTIDGYRWTPARLVGQLPRTLEGAAAREATAAWERLRGCTGLQP